MSQPEFTTVVDDNPELQPVSPSASPKQTALAVVPSPPSMAVGPPISAPLTPEQAKVNAIADLTHAAYAKASTLALTAEEQAALQKDFPDEAFKPGAAGKESLIYIEHAFLRDRFNQVFGPGQWALIPRSRWAEDYTTNAGKPAVRVYVEAMLMVRGCFVAEAVGDMSYFKHNESQNYGDAVEGAKTAALRRCCKELGVGLQAWKKDFCEGWWARKRNFSKTRTAPVDSGRAETGQGVSTHPPQAQTQPQQAAGKPKETTIPHATAETRQKLIERLMALQNVGEEQILEYFRKLDNPTVLLPTEGLLDLPLEFVPVTQKQFEALKVAIVAFTEGSPVKHAFPPNPVAPPAPAAKSRQPKDSADAQAQAESESAEAEDVEPEDAWRAFPMPWGKQAGVPLGELEKNYLFGLWANFKVELEYNGKPKKPETIAKDKTFRKMLDDAGAYYEFKHKD